MRGVGGRAVRVGAGAAATIAVLVGLLLTGGTAGASALRGPGTPLPGTWLGSYATFGGVPWVWCTDAGRAAPESGYSWTEVPVTAPSAAYLLATHGDVAEAENHAALSYLVHTSPDLPHDAGVGVPPQPPPVAGMDLPGRVATLRDDAARNAGPYTVPTSMTLEPDGRSAQVSTVVLSAAGHPVVGRRLVARVDGSAAFEAGGTVVEATSDAEPSTWRVVPTGDGPVTVTVEADVPPVDVTLLDPGRAGVQRVVAPRGTAVVTGTATASLRSTFVPQVTTRTSDADTAPGSVLTDALVVETREGTSWPEGVEVDVTSTLWGPFEARPVEAEAAPADAPVAGVVTTRVDGPGEFVTPGIEVPGAGYYVWTEEIAADEHQTGWAGRFGVAEETSLARWQPSVETRTSDAVTYPGAELRDHLVVSGARPGAELVVRSTLWGPFEERPAQAASAPPGAPVVGTLDTVVDGPGDWTTAPLVVLAPGWYVWTETLPEDEHHAAWASPFGRVAETTQVSSPAAPPPVVEQPTPPAVSGAPQRPGRVEVGPTAELPRTGAEPGAATWAGAGLLVVGGGLVAAGRRRASSGRHRARRGTPAPVARPAPAARAAGGRATGWVPQRPA